MPYTIPAFPTVACVFAALLFPATPSLAQEARSAAKGGRAVAETTVEGDNRSAASLPNGAASINEVYGDWTVDCAVADNRKRCGFSQQLGDSQTGQRLFAIELRPPADGQTNGILVLPFGLSLDEGVTLKLDEQKLGQGARFSTCLPTGCLVPVSFPTIATDAMKKGEKLVIAATRDGGGEPPAFTVSLDGFTAAIGRVSELAK